MKHFEIKSETPDEHERNSAMSTIVTKTVKSTAINCSSGYGVGPFGSDGLPILGLKALKNPVNLDSKFNIQRVTVFSINLST